MPYMVTFIINILQMLAYVPYMDSMGIDDPGIPANSNRLPSFESSPDMGCPGANRHGQVMSSLRK